MERSGWLSWLQWRGGRATPLIGVDIAPDGVRIIELQGTAHAPRIAHHARVPLEAGDWASARHGDGEALTQALRRALKVSGTRQRQAALALPGAAVITRTLSLPRPAHDDELERMVEADAAQSLPFPRDEISLDFTLLGPSAGDDGMVDVLLVAARSERIAQRIAWAEAAGLTPIRVAVESQALVAVVARACGAVHHSEAIVHIAGESAHCLFLRGEHLLLERELGEPLPAATQADDGVGIPEIEHWLDVASLEWQRHAHLFAASATDGQVDRIHLAGAGVLGPQLAAGLRQRLGIDVDIPDPFQYWPSAKRRVPEAAAFDTALVPDTHTKRRDNDVTGGADFLLACGLALQGLSR